MIGIKSGMVMQRNERNVCKIWLKSEEQITQVNYTGNVSGMIKTIPLENDRYLLEGIPVGGPYTVEINHHSFSDIYVGDVWVLAGQSNMEGVGWLTEEDKTFCGDKDIRALYMEDEWRPAKHPLHTMWTAVDKVHTEVLGCKTPGASFRGVGPGLRFAQKMKEYTNVPQGLLCCAHGGTTMEQWSPKIKNLGPDKSLYAAMLRRFHANGSHVRGMFWHQGCSEACCHTNNEFAGNMKEFIAQVREDFNDFIPVVQVQIATVLNMQDSELPFRWSDIREKQRTLSEQIEKLDTIATINLSLDDMIHLSNPSQRKLGEDAAESMYCLLYGSGCNQCLPAPQYKTHRVYSDEHSGAAVVEVEYKNIHGKLISSGRPYGFELTEEVDRITYFLVHDIHLEGNKAILRIAFEKEKLGDPYLYYGFGLNPYCNITDEKGRSIPAMGPIKLNL